MPGGYESRTNLIVIPFFSFHFFSPDIGRAAFPAFPASVFDMLEVLLRCGGAFGS